jgi:hypothetical protein
MKHILPIMAIIAGLTVVGCDQLPDDAEIARLEATIKLDQLPHWKEEPPHSLSAYARYYTASWNGERVILGELVLGDGRALGGDAHTPGVHMVSSRSLFPRIFDGGCTVVNLVYSVEKQRILSIKCNGYA